MAIDANQHIILGIHEPKKDAVVGTGAPTVGDDEIAIWSNTADNNNLTTHTIATYRTLFRAAMEGLKDGAIGIAVSGVIDTSVHNVAVAAPNVGELGLYIGATTADGDRSHFFDRTLKRLLERWLELAKAGV